MPKPRLRAKLLLLLIALLIVPVLLLLAEVSIRLFGRHIDPLEVFVTSPQLRSDTQGETTAGLFEFDPQLVWRLKPNLRQFWWDYTPVSTNAAHLRLDHEVGPKRGRRIVCLGDSVTFGYRVPVVADRNQPTKFDPAAKPYPALLEVHLRERFPQQEIEVLPLACPGYTSGQGLAWLRRDIDQLKPDVVTVCFGWNDVRAAGLPDRATMPQGAQATARSFIVRSQLLLHITDMAQRRNAPALPPAPEPRSSQQEFVDNITAMAALCRERSIGFLVILPVYRDPNTPGDYPEGTGQSGDSAEGQRMAAYRTALQAGTFEKLSIPQLTEAGWPGNADLFGERIHPNAAGHELMASKLAELLIPIVGTISK